VPIVVDGRVWGVIAAGATDRQALPPDIDARLTQFTELVATAISNTQAREDLRRLADEQAALRRIATLVAQGTEARAVFDAVCEETGRLLAATTVNLAHFTPEGLNRTMAGWSVRGVHVPTGTLLPLDGETINAVVQRTAAPGRFDSYEGAPGELAAHLRRLGIRSEVGAPVVIEGRVWGALIAGTDEPQPLPPGSELRLASFAELIATAVSNATARADLIASRARIVQAADEQRRRVVRDLHDGAQQRLLHAVMTLQLAHGRDDAPPELTELVGQALEHARAAIEELRELAHGIHPAILTHRGLAAAVEGLADRAPLPVHVEIPEHRYPAIVESAAYFIAAEALTNVAKYAQASTARITATRSTDRLVVAVEDDGAGGANPYPGSGLSGLRDRVAALDGTLTVDSPPGAGTRIRAEIPLRHSDGPEQARSADAALRAHSRGGGEPEAS
jgi:signal transduction histidine kinase